ncbi:MAG: hypothetical protein VB861_00785 [Planctomycetaceae bacterium]
MTTQRILACVFYVTVVGVVPAEPSQLDKELAALSPDVLSVAQREQFKDQTWQYLRARGDVVNRRDVSKWAAIRTRTDWEQLREKRLKQLRMALGGFPAPPQKLDVRITKQIDGDGFVIQNLVYRTRPGMWVTANLYRPSTTDKKMPGLLIAHSHHRPKTQGELQDMGMTWARQGCMVLVIDQVGHGERADHPFRSERDYRKPDSGFRWWRQDYYYRFDTNAQLHLVGQSLMGWMVWDLMRGVDLLLAQPNIDPDKLIILGSVAGGGDPAAVTAALDRRIDAAVPFNFGGPQPETRLPLPEDAALRFNYLGGAYWEGTRNLRRSGVDGFFHWLIVASTAPRPLLYAHEFAWDKERDPVWQRLNKIYAFYDSTKKIDYVAGRGNVKLRPPNATHCTNIGRIHRERIHLAFKRWFDINVTQEEEYSRRLEPADLRSMSDKARRNLKPKKLFEIVTGLGRGQVNTARKRLANTSAADRRRQLRSDWKQLLGNIQPRQRPRVHSQKTETVSEGSVVIERIALQTEPGIVVPMLVLSPNHKEKKPSRVVVAVSQSGKEKFLRERSREIAELLEGGATVCLPDVRGAGRSRGSRGELGSASYYALFFETPLLGYRLRDFRAVLKYLRTRKDLASSGFALWGDSFATPNPTDTDFQVPKRVNRRPAFSEPLGGLLVMLGALFEDDVTAVYSHGNLSGYLDALASPYVYIPHDVVVPGVLTGGDLADLAAALAPCPMRLDGVVDGLNRKLSLDVVRSIYKPATRTYQSHAASIALTDDQSNVAQWLLNATDK